MGRKGITIRNAEYLKELLQSSSLSIRKAYLFGCRARGDYLEESDWDVVAISPEFKDIPFPQRATLLAEKVLLRRWNCPVVIPERSLRRGRELDMVAEACQGKRLV